MHECCCYGASLQVVLALQVVPDKRAAVELPTAADKIAEMVYLVQALVEEVAFYLVY